MTHIPAIVIGSGLGGSVAAAVLARNGFEVTVIDKNPRPGGVCSYYEKDGFRVDVGTHMFTRGHRGPFGRIARRVDATLPQFVQPVYIADLRALGTRLELPTRPELLPRFLMQLAIRFRLTPPEIVEAGRFFAAILTMSDEDLTELETTPMWDVVLEYTRNPRLVAVFGLLLGLYFVLPLKEVSAAEGIWCFQRMLRDRALSYPRGGATTVPGAFLDAAVRDGATIRLRRRVRRILVRNGCVEGVELARGQVLRAPVVVSTTSLRDLVEDLVPAGTLPDVYVERVRRLRGSLIAVQAKIALDRPLIRAGALVGATSDTVTMQNLKLDDFDRMYEQVVSGRVPEMVPIYAPIPTNFDPSLGPPGTQLITACAVAPTLDVPLVDEPAMWIDAMMNALRKMEPRLDRHLMWVDTMDVRFITRWMGKKYGPAITCGQTIDQVGFRRPPVRTPVRGLYVAGCGAGGRGVGTELAAVSGEEAADTILRDCYNGLIGLSWKDAAA